MMLQHVRRLYFIVYPSWAKFDYGWEELSRLMSDPLSSGLLNPRQDWYGLGYPRDVQPFLLRSGPVGGGLIEVHAAPTEKWLPNAILSRIADIALPAGAMFGSEPFPQVYFLDPQSGPLTRLPFSPAEFRWKAKRYVCATKAEYIEDADNAIFWMIRLNRGRRPIKGLEDIELWADHFGITARRLDEPPQSVKGTGDWFSVRGDDENLWYEVVSDDDRFDFHFAVLVYIAYHLRWIVGSRVVSMHLVTDAER